MQSNLAILSLLAFALPAAIAAPTEAEIVLTESEASAVTIKTFPNMIGCGWGVSGHYETFPDGECFHLSRDYMDVKSIAETCRGLFLNLQLPQKEFAN